MFGQPIQVYASEGRQRLQMSVSWLYNFDPGKLAFLQFYLMYLGNNIPLYFWLCSEPRYVIHYKLFQMCLRARFAQLIRRVRNSTIGWLATVGWLVGLLLLCMVGNLWLLVWLPTADWLLGWQLLAVFLVGNL